MDTTVAGSIGDYVVSSIKSLTKFRTAPVIAAYLVFVGLSRVWSKYVPAMGLKKVMIAYNFICAVVSLYCVALIIKALIPGWPLSLFSLEHNEGVKYAMLIYWSTKIFELMDTVFMILRHRHRQISFLHVYHHSTMAMLGEFAYMRGDRPAISVPLGLNCIIHAFLYWYYAQSALSPGQRPAWKKRLTQMQILQFYIDLAHSITGYFYYGFCTYVVLYEFTMLTLFSNFYFRAYLSRPPQKKSE